MNSQLNGMNKKKSNNVMNQEMTSWKNKQMRSMFVLISY